jgi:membrane protein implicated in regulation of membrane protease activity
VRALELDVPTAEGELRQQELAELSILDRRMSICHLSIGLCTASALLICMVVMTLFVAGLGRMDFGVPVSLLFIGATACLTLSLLLFLAEITIATRFVRVNDEYVRGHRQRVKERLARKG